MQFSPSSVFLTFRSKYPPQHSVLKNPQSISLLQSERPSLALIQHSQETYSFVYFNIQFFDMRQEDKWFWTEWRQAFPEFNLLFISSWISFWLVSGVPKYLNSATFSNDSLAIPIFWFCPEFEWRDMITYFVCCGDLSYLKSLKRSNSNFNGFLKCTPHMCKSCGGREHHILHNLD
jgi:hypothetical protein